ncbi:MAG: hypothetical protein L0K27_04170 [Corynebacterium nuruki]|nr:hypothetical protein [Corynebacterium nuruki]
MGDHQRQGRGGRKVAAWVWVTPLVIVVIAVLVVGWLALIRDRGDDSAQACLSGDLTLQVWSDPAAEPSALQLVDGYNAGSPVVRDHCVRATVEVKDTPAAVDAYRAGAPGVAPVWFPATAGDAAGLPGAPATVPVAHTAAGDVPVVAFGSSPAVEEDAARAAADFVGTVVPEGS